MIYDIWSWDQKLKDSHAYLGCKSLTMVENSDFSFLAK